MFAVVMTGELIIRLKVNNSGLSGALFYALKIAYINFMMYLCSEVVI